jgi:hypothetical protein
MVKVKMVFLPNLSARKPIITFPAGTVMGPRRRNINLSLWLRLPIIEPDATNGPKVAITPQKANESEVDAKRVLLFNDKAITSLKIYHHWQAFPKFPICNNVSFYPSAGITRIRFKGSIQRILSAFQLP